VTLYRHDEDIIRIGHGLLDRSLPKPEWTHAAHFAAAIWLLRHCPDQTAPAAIAAIIRAYNEATGTANTDSSGYHETITRASMRAAAAHLSRYPADAPLLGIVNDLIASPLGNRDWLLAYWRRDTLFSTAARRNWVAADLAPLPF